MKNMCIKHSVFQRAVSIICALALSAGLAQPVFAADSGQLSDHVVTNTVDPSGISLNLFDYWVTSQNAADTDTPLDTYRSSGINNGHQLKVFSKSGDDYDGTINAWTGNSTPFTGIVNKQLKDGYPVLASGNPCEWFFKTTEESLSYLFDTTAVTGKQAFTNVKGLLQIDDNGYYLL